MDSNRFSKTLPTNKISQDQQTTSTYYYGIFDLFDDSLNFFFLKYQIFKKILRLSLGETWHTYAKETLYKEVENSKVFIHSDLVFNQALELWLELRKEINLTLNASNYSEIHENNKNFIEKKFEDGDIYEIFELKFAEKYYTCFKAVLQGFYATANKVWKDTIEEQDLNLTYLKPTHYEEKKNDEIEEESNFQYLKNTLKSFTKSSSKK